MNLHGGLMRDCLDQINLLGLHALVFVCDGRRAKALACRPRDPLANSQPSVIVRLIGSLEHDACDIQCIGIQRVLIREEPPLNLGDRNEKIGLFVELPSDQVNLLRDL